MDKQKQSEFSRHVQRKLDQRRHYGVTGLHPDLNGRLGGIECMVANLEPRKGAGMCDDILVAYILVDCLDTVQSIAQGEPSRWDVARLLCRAMRVGIPRRRLRDAIESEIRGHVGGISGTELLRVQLIRQTPPEESLLP